MPGKDITTFSSTPTSHSVAMTDKMFSDLNWNGAVPYETLAIRLNGAYKEFSESTVGYYKGPYGQDQVFKGNYNYMRLEYSKEPSGHWEASIPEIAHEVRLSDSLRT
jgi:hypothetical protein